LRDPAQNNHNPAARELIKIKPARFAKLSNRVPLK
jgi:hypothetical protein